MDQTTSDNTLPRDLELALTALVKLTKALKFYPAQHPALTQIAEESCRDFQPLLTHHDPQPYHVTRDGFYIDRTALAPKNARLKELARLLLERRVRHLLFLPDLADHELIAFAQEIIRPANDLLIAGGLPDRLQEQGIRSIWINETSLETILSHLRSEIAATKGESGIADGLEFELPDRLSVSDELLIARVREVLELLKEPLEDEEHGLLLEEVRQKALPFLRHTGIPGCLALFSLLLSRHQDTSRSETQRQAAAVTIDQLLQPDICQMLINGVADRQLKASQQRALVRLLIGLEMKIAPQLLQRLYEERDAIIRRQYTGILAHMGQALFPLLEKSLHSPQWYIVRNAAYILGETRLPAALPILAQTLKHPEMRVRRALIRALSSIGTDDVIPMLIELSHDSCEELHRPAIMAIGGLGNPRAVPPLIAQLQELDLLGKQSELKVEIIRALAAIKSPEAIEPLLKLAKKPNLLRLRHVENLRAEAIVALGQLGTSQLLPLLDQLPNSGKGLVSRALQQARTQLGKQKHAT